MNEFILHVTQAENGFVIKLSPPYVRPGTVTPSHTWIVGENDKLHEVLAQAIASSRLEKLGEVNADLNEQKSLFGLTYR